MEAKETLLKVRNLNKVFKNKNVVVKAINNASFEVKKGEVVGLIGESGSGKTTIGRTVIGLHEATSGIMELENQDITNYSLRKVRKNVVRNIQMIFQDPYSSLNGQKNVLSIVSEPVIANKLWKKEVHEALANRSKILKYYKFSLIEWYFKKFNAYRIYANKTAYDFVQKLNQKLVKFKLDPQESKEVNFNALLSIFYRERHEGNFKILEKLVTTEEELFSKWQKFNQNIETLKNIPYDEKALIKIDAELAQIKALIKHSQKSLTLQAQLREAKVVLTQARKEKEFNLKRAKNNFTKIKGFLSDDIKIQVTEKKLAETNVNHRFYAKKAELAKAKKEFLKTTWSQLNHKVWLDMEHVSNFFNEEFAQKQNRTSFIKHLRAQNVKIAQELETKITEQEAKVKTLTSQIKVENSNPRAKEVKKYQAKYAEKLVAKQEAIKVFEKETKIFLEKFNVEHQANLAAANTKINETISEYKKYKTENAQLFKSLLSKLEEDFPQDVFSKRKIKEIVKKEEEKNSALEIELKNVHKNIKIVKQLFAISKSVKPLLFLALRKLIIRNKVYEALKHSGLKTSYAYRYPHEFSGGMRQRVGIARAIIGEPKLIIADEPIAALDLSIQAQVVNMLLDQRDRLDLAMIFIAHDLSMVRFNSDRVLIMHLGRIVEYGETEKIFKKPVHPYTINLMKSMPTIKKASKKIEVYDFKPTYLDAYTATNQPTYHKVGTDHFVLATPTQIKKWN